MVIDHLDNESFVACSGLSKELHALSLHPERLKQRILAEGAYPIAEANPPTLMKKLKRIIQLRANLKAGHVTTSIETHHDPRNLVEINNEVYYICSKKKEDERTREPPYPFKFIDTQPRSMHEKRGRLPGEKFIWEVKTPVVLKRCGHEGRYIPVPQLPSVPPSAYVSISKNLRFFMILVDNFTFITQEGSDVSTRKSHQQLDCHDVAYVGTHLLHVSSNAVRVFDAQNGHALVRSFVLPNNLGASLSDDGRLLAVLESVSVDIKRLKFFDVSTGESLHAYPSYGRIEEDFRYHNAFDPTGRFFAAVDGAARLKVIDVRNGEVETLTAAETEGDSFVGVCFSPMRDVMAVSTVRGDIRVYRKKGTKLELLTSLIGRSTRVLRPGLAPFSFNESGSRVYGVDADGNFKSIDMRGSPVKLAFWRRVFRVIQTAVSYMMKIMHFMKVLER